MKSRRDAAALPPQGEAIHGIGADSDDESATAANPSRHSRHSHFLSSPQPPLAPLDPLPVRARVGTQPPGSRLVERAAAVVARVKTGRHSAMAAPLSAPLSPLSASAASAASESPPSPSPSVAAASSPPSSPTARVASATAQLAAISPHVTPASPLPPSALPSPTLPPSAPPLPPASPRSLQPLLASHPYPPPATPLPSSPKLPATPPPAPPTSSASSASSSASSAASSAASASPAPPFTITVPPFASSATSLAISLAVVENPGAETFSVRATLHWSGQGGAERTAEIGRIIPPPAAPDEPATAVGTFLLPLSSAARELLRQREGKTQLRLTLRSHSPSGDAGLHVKILPPRWH